MSVEHNQHGECPYKSLINLQCNMHSEKKNLGNEKYVWHGKKKKSSLKDESCWMSELGPWISYLLEIFDDNN